MRLIFALSVAAVMSAGCASEPTKEELLSRADAAFAAARRSELRKPKHFEDIVSLADFLASLEHIARFSSMT
jgi:hypothetical protein